MVKKMFGVFTAIVAALAVVGVAWAAGSDDPVSSVLADDSTSRTSVTTGSSTPSTSASTPTTSASSTSTSNGGNSTTSTSVGSTSTSNGGNSTTSTSIASTTSTSTGSSTSTSFDDNDDRVIAPDGRSTHTIPGVGTVTIEVRNGELILVGVSAPGWSVEHDKIRSDEIELEFHAGKAEAEFEAKIRHGQVRVEIEVDDDDD